LELVCENERAIVLKELLDAAKVQYEMFAPVSVVSAVGEGICGAVDIVPGFVQALQEVGARSLILSVSSLSIQAAVPSEQAAVVTQALHRRFIQALENESANTAPLSRERDSTSPIQ
jgi:aspartokinase